MKNDLAPIALFVYARPSHTRKTLEALQNNKLAEKSMLYIFSDGPKAEANDKTLGKISEVRSLIRKQQWCKQVQIIEADNNRGLAKSIIEGVSQVVNKHGRVIVLEDDLETSPGFLKYMNNALALYQNESRVFQVSGFMVRNSPWVAKTGFLRVSTSWGWATWQRAWKHYQSDAESLLREVELKGQSEFNLDDFSFHYDELKRNINGDLNTWAVRWYASIFLKDGLCLYPKRTLVRNHGFDGSGINCHNDGTKYHRDLSLAKSIDVNPLQPKENAQYLNAMQSHYHNMQLLWTRTRLRDRIFNKSQSILKKLRVISP